MKKTVTLILSRTRGGGIILSKIIIGVHAGHSKKGIGEGAIGYIHESTYARKIVHYVIKTLREYGYTVKNTTVDTGNQKEVLQGISKKSIDCNYNISIHLNSGGGQGFETLVKKTTPKIKALNDETATLFGLKNRGVKVRNDLYVLNKLNNCTIFECGFVDNLKDSAYVKNNYQYIGKIIAINYHEYLQKIRWKDW